MQGGIKMADEKLIKPFTIDHDGVAKTQVESMVPTEDSKISNIADELKIPEKQDEKSILLKNKTDYKEEKKTKGVLEAAKKTMIKPFEILAEGAADPTRKLYLVLLYIGSDSDNEEDTKDFFFVKGRQAVFNAIKDALENYNVDAMRSLIFVDSPKVTISTKTTVYQFMKDMINTNKVINDTNFDINDYYYEIDDTENE